MVGTLNRSRSRAESVTVLAVGIVAAVLGFWRWTGFEESLEPLGLVGWPAAPVIPIAVVRMLGALPFLPVRPSARAMRLRIARWGRSGGSSRGSRRWRTLPRWRRRR